MPRTSAAPMPTAEQTAQTGEAARKLLRNVRCRALSSLVVSMPRYIGSASLRPAVALPGVAPGHDGNASFNPRTAQPACGLSIWPTIQAAGRRKAIDPGTHMIAPAAAWSSSPAIPHGRGLAAYDG